MRRTPPIFRLAPSGVGMLRWLIEPRRLLGLAWLSTLALAEMAGRRSPSDVLDIWLVSLLVVLGVITAGVHRRQRIEIVDRAIAVGRKSIAHLRRQSIRMGVDLRETPPLPKGFPPLIAWSLLAVAIAAAAAIRFHELFPGAAREAVRSLSGALYVVLLAIWWAFLVATALTLFLFTLAGVHDYLVNSSRITGRQRSALESWGAILLLAVLVTLSGAVHPEIALGLMAATLAFTVAALALPGCPSVLVVWQSRSGGDPAVIPWTRLVLAYSALFAGALVLMVFLASGDRIGDTAGGTTPVTWFLGSWVAWSGVGAYAAWAWMVPVRALTQRFRDPARTKPTTVRLVGRTIGDTSDHGADLRRNGIDVRRDRDRPRRDDVVLRLENLAVPLPKGASLPTPLRWPLTLHPDDLDHPEVAWRLRERDAIQRRRRLLRGLERLVKAAARREFTNGMGLWIAVHLWFVTRLSRDTNEDDSWSVGPPIHRAIPLSARSHLHQVLKALDVDLIFVEDGIPFRRWKRVFRILFELYDIFGASGRIEDHHFVGLQGLKVVLHDFTMERPFRAEGYPEVDYQEIGRARILHVFNDRGGDDDSADVPMDADLVPEPAAV